MENVVERYIKIRVHNMERGQAVKPVSGKVARDIIVRDMKGRALVIQDNTTVEVSEYVYNALVDAEDMDYEKIERVRGMSPEDDIPAKWASVPRKVYDVVALGDFYYRDKDKMKLEARKGRPKKVVEETAGLKQVMA